MASKKYVRNKETKKLAVGFTLSCMALHGHYGHYSRAELRRLLNAEWDFFLLAPNPKRYLEKLKQFLDGLEEHRKSPYYVGPYSSKQSKR